MIPQADILSNEARKAQQTASDPSLSAWVSASAGSGKTKVLIDRILRLLLSKEVPETILCLTYTKAAAAEMENRLTQKLRKWVVVSDEALQQELKELTGNDDVSEDLPFARTLFARILEVKGGFKMMTIHSFCESLLKRFPLEANISPSFEIIDETQSQVMLQNAMMQTFEKQEYAESLTLLSEYVGEKKLLSLLKDILERHRAKVEQLLSFMSIESVQDKVYSILHVSPDMSEDELKKSICLDGDFDELKSHYLTQKNEILSSIKKEGGEKYAFAEKILSVIDKINALNTAKATCALLRVIMDVFARYDSFKQNKGVLDYADLIEKTSNLLTNNETTAWVLYKLDGGINHILLDEAQDTSPEQWNIIRAITEEFFSGLNGKEDKLRTLFVVGDKKQSIYRFQGADAKEFEKMRGYFAKRITDSQNDFRDVRLNISFRSAQPVLDVVNMLLENPCARKGVANQNENVKHLAYRSGFAGVVEIWPLETSPKKEKKEEINLWDFAEQTNEETPSVRRVAVKIAKRIKKMLDDKEILPSVNRPVRASDIMILVRSRNRQGVVEQMLKALKEEKIPVSGIDRLILNKHIAIEDLMSLGSFLLLPDDDLALAEVLKSPMFDLSEKDLFDLSARRKDKSLWANVALKNEKIYNVMKDLLSKTDVLLPFELYTYILDVLGYRKNFIARLGPETNEMIDEFLNLSLKFERDNVPSLESFLQFLKKDDIEIKRDLDNTQIDAVRIMTVHGSKGLQSKIVFLPDAYSKQVVSPDFVWKDGVPIWIPDQSKKANICKDVIDDIRSEETDEYNRLLYVALTRAEDRLYICGFKNNRDAPENNWYDMLAESIPSYDSSLGCMLSSSQTAEAQTEKKAEQTKPYCEFLPNWFDKSVPEEPIPSKPLSPSKLTEDNGVPSPLTPEQEKAMERGSFIHKLLEYLPEVPVQDRKTFVKNQTPKDVQLPKNLLDLFDKTEFKDLFSSNSQAEVPIIGTTTDGKVICGQIDRLVIKSDEVLIVDYKTNRYSPKSKENIPVAYIEQLNAYKDLLKNIFPDKKIRSFLLWTTDSTFTEI